MYQRVNNVPDFRPTFNSTLSKCFGMFAVFSKARTIRIVIELNHFFSPPEKHWKATVQDCSYGHLKRKRPQFYRSYGRVCPIVIARKLPQFAAILQKMESFFMFFCCLHSGCADIHVSKPSTLTPILKTDLVS